MVEKERKGIKYRVRESELIGLLSFSGCTHGSSNDAYSGNVDVWFF